MKSDPQWRKDRHRTPRYIDWLKKEAERIGVPVSELYSETRQSPKRTGKVRNMRYIS